VFSRIACYYRIDVAFLFGFLCARGFGYAQPPFGYALLPFGTGLRLTSTTLSASRSVQAAQCKSHSLLTAMLRHLWARGFDYAQPPSGYAQPPFGSTLTPLGYVQEKPSKDYKLDKDKRRIAIGLSEDGV